MADHVASIAPALHLDPPPPLPDAEAERRAAFFAPLNRNFSAAEASYERAMMLPSLQRATAPATGMLLAGGRQPPEEHVRALRDFPGNSYRGGATAPGVYGGRIVEGDIVRSSVPLMQSALLSDADRASRVFNPTYVRPYVFAVEGPGGRQFEVPRADGNRFGAEIVFPARSEFSIVAIRDTPARTLVWARPYFGASSQPIKNMHTGESIDPPQYGD